jgi:G:T-mismatch repair DNA endonuclease (very short patch repair protein)
MATAIGGGFLSSNKILSNIERDKKVNDYYNSINWTILRFWQSDIEKNLNEYIIQTLNTINTIKQKTPRDMDGAERQ